MDMITKENHKFLYSFPVGKWYKWFAWKPVKTWDGKWKWLVIVERRLQQMHEYLSRDAGKQFFEYD